MTAGTGLAGRLAATFIPSKLTPLLIAGSIALGAFAILALPREEEPQIIVPMVDVFVAMPGASPAEVEQRVTRPMEKLLWEVPGRRIPLLDVEPRPVDGDRPLSGRRGRRAALVRLNQKLQANFARIPPGASPPIVKPRSIDDVPIVAVTLWGDGYDDDQLRGAGRPVARSAGRSAGRLGSHVAWRPAARDCACNSIRRRLAAVAIDPLQVSRALEAANARATAAGPSRAATSRVWRRARALETSARCATSSSSAQRGRLRSGCATSRGWTDGDAPADRRTSRFYSRDGGSHPAVTLAVAKRKGANAITVAHQVEAKLATVRPALLPADLNVTVTRNYGETAAEKSNELLYHMVLAVVSVSAAHRARARRREAVVVLIAIPVTLALTLFVFCRLRLHAEPHHAVCADLLDRHPRRRRDRRGGEHRAARAHARGRRIEPGRDRGPRR